MDVLTGQILCPRSPPDIIAQYVGTQIPEEEWVVEGACAYVPQVGFYAVPFFCDWRAHFVFPRRLHGFIMLSSEVYWGMYPARLISEAGHH